LKDAVIVSNNEITVREFLSNYAKSIGQDLRSIQPFIDALEKDWYFNIDSSLALITEDKWKEYGIPDRLVREMKLVADKMVQNKRRSEQLELQQMTKRTIAMFRLSTDLGKKDKLEDVTVVQGENTEEQKESIEEKKESIEEKKESIEEKKESIEEKKKIEEIEEKIEETKIEEQNSPLASQTPPAPHLNKGIVKEIARVINDLAIRLESEELQLKIAKRFEEILQREKFSDLEGLVEDLFRNTIGINSKIGKVMKVIHQNIIFTAVFQLKTKVPMTTMTRDVRSREGWRINITFVNNIVVVSHKRREQSLATSPPEEQYWFEWELRITFDKNLLEMESATLRITDLQFGEKISPRKREEIKLALSSGSLIIA